LLHLLESLRPESLVFIDPDIMFFHSPELVRDRLRLCDILLTPHFSEPADPIDGRLERIQLSYGIYNGGFVGVRTCENGGRFLRWWEERTLRFSCEDPAMGIFTDQRWLDFVPGLFPNVNIERHPGFNVARWNLSGRQIVRAGERLVVNGEPLIFFHFTQLRPGADLFAYLWNRPVSPVLRSVVEEYFTALFAKGYSEDPAARRPLAQDCYPNGQKIAPLFRQVLREEDGEPLRTVPFCDGLQPHEIMRQLVDNRGEVGIRLRIRTYYSSRIRRVGTPEELLQRYRRSAWFRRWIDCWFYFFGPRNLHFPEEWVEPSHARRRLRAWVGVIAQRVSQLLRRFGA
jgi:hypothetical protein